MEIQRPCRKGSCYCLRGGKDQRRNSSLSLLQPPSNPNQKKKKELCLQRWAAAREKGAWGCLLKGKDKSSACVLHGKGKKPSTKWFGKNPPRPFSLGKGSMRLHRKKKGDVLRILGATGGKRGMYLKRCGCQPRALKGRSML